MLPHDLGANLMPGPYGYQRLVKSQVLHQSLGNQMSTLVELELADRVALPQEEWIKAQTRVPLPLASGQTSIEVAALIRLRDRLDEQIKAMTQLP
jgi:hypothetical protein